MRDTQLKFNLPLFEPNHEKTCLFTGENKCADQLRGKPAADRRLCFQYIDTTITLLPKSEISSLLPSSVIVQSSLCDVVGNPEDRYSRDVAHLVIFPGMPCMTY